MIYVVAFLFCLVYSSESLQHKQVCAFGSYPPKNRPIIPTYVIRLDLPPAKRWTELGRNKSKQIGEIFASLKETFLNVTEYSKYLIDFIDNNVAQLVDTFPSPFGEELRGLAEASQLPLGEIVLYNIFYEVFSLCTSILAHDRKGNLYHARNLDFGLFLGWDEKLDTWKLTEILKKVVVNLEWYNEGKLVFRSVGYAGHIGVLTGMKPKVLSLTINERFDIDGGYLGIFKWLLGYRDNHWNSFLTRQIMENVNNYEDAKLLLATKELLAPVYFVLGGKTEKEGCIITRSRRKTIDVWNIGTRNSTFFLTQTNYDHWNKPPFFDDRATTAINCMESLSIEKVGVSGLYDVLSSKPVLNKLTTYTTVMHVASDDVESYVQSCPDPCPPW